MAYQIEWSPKAISNLEEVCAYIAKDSEYYARLFATRVVTIISSIPDFPRAGRVVPEYDDENIREKIYGNYRIIYRIRENIIEIAAITHSAKLLQD